MRVVFVQSYPVYHERTLEEWLRLENRDRWMPGVLARLGAEVELWAADREESLHTSRMDGFPDYPIRVFPADPSTKQTKFHRSGALARHARRDPADLFIVKGADGGVGVHLVEEVLRPGGRAYAVVIGGEYYTRIVPGARFVFYETERQRRLLEGAGWRAWRRRVPRERLIPLPKSVDTERFRPLPAVEKTRDLLTVGRLMTPYKRYDELGALAGLCRVAVAGGGPAAERLRREMPEVEWLGPVPNHALPEVYNSARAFIHAGKRDHYPRVLAEAGACGIPCIGFRDAFSEDVIPPDCGLLVDRRGFQEPILHLLDDAPRLARMSRCIRERAVASMGKESSRAALETMLERLAGGERT